MGVEKKQAIKATKNTIAFSVGNGLGVLSQFTAARDRLPYFLGDHSSNFLITIPGILAHTLFILLSNPTTLKRNRGLANVVLSIINVGTEMAVNNLADNFFKEAIPDMAVGFLGIYVLNKIVANATEF
ncbi:hypothetical protein CANDROIZ_410004 [Candidatus Roizmanbacteria bacterium]|nr:hypothetical protein CANDROIZ_410004 [Candidatus Roizmanbacteria bacterium]